MLQEMQFTGERFVPQVHGNIELEHMHRYLIACDLAVDKDVLDIACGEGYGTAMLARRARQVHGVDISSETVAHACAKYNSPNTRFIVGSCDAIPLPNQSVDLVVSFETIEHHDKHEEMMLEIKRVLRPNGVIIISSPDKKVYSLEANYSNPFHVKELFSEEFRKLLANHFKNTRTFGQKISYGSLILENQGKSPQKTYWDEDGEVRNHEGSRKPLYELIVASDSVIPLVHSGIYERPEWESGHASFLSGIIADRDRQLADRDRQLTYCESVINSAKSWQKRSWTKRAFHRWRAPGENQKKTNLFKKLERSIRKRRDYLYIKIGFKKKSHNKQRGLLNLAFHHSGKPRGWVRFLLFHRNREPRRLFRRIVCRKSGSPRKSFIKWLSQNKKISRAHSLPLVQVGPISKKLIEHQEPAITFIRAIAIYLPQFHPIPENDEWWGKGFTEWTNVRRATPQYEGHYQPHVPHPDLSYYDLNDPAVMEKQANMARAAGIEGFCFYYYWFNGRRLLNMPTDRLLVSGKPDFPFCFCWANENWTRTWDGGDKEILLGQEHTYESDERFILDLLPAFRDPRYIRVDGKPLLVIYRPGLLPDPAATARHWRETCRREGIGEIFLAFMLGFEAPAPSDIGYDCAIQMPPLRSAAPIINERIKVHDRVEFVGEVRDYCHLPNMFDPAVICEHLWPSVCPSWDNTARRMERGHSWVRSSPEAYHQWLATAVARAQKVLPSQKRFVFINAWNEWAEGCHLEPDEKHGYAWLNATRFALTGIKPPRCCRVLVIGHDAHMAGAEIVLLSLLKEWSKTEDVSFDLVLRDGGALLEQFESLTKTLVLTDCETSENFEKELRGLVANNYDVVLSSTVTNGKLLDDLRKFGLQAPVITYSHELQKSIERWAGDGIMEMTVANSGRFIAGGIEVGRNLVSTHKVPNSRLDIVHAFIDIWDESRMPDDTGKKKMAVDLGNHCDDIVVFGCGSTDWRKGPDLFLSIAERCCEKSDRIRFIWIGGESEKYNALAAKSNYAKQIRFLPNTLDSRRYYYTGDIFLLSSREDPFPLVALEAADAGLPIICFENAGGMPRFVKDDAGIVVPFEDVVAAADAVLSLALDNEKRLSFGRNAQERVRSCHSTPAAAAEVAQILRKNCGYGDRQKLIADHCTGSPMVTVIVPNYNHEKYLPQRLNSIANQTFRDLEIILLDDYSTDNSLEVLRDFEAREPRARLIPNESNSGSTFKQWKKGILEARGKYVWIAESDDSAEPQLIEKLVSNLESDPNINLACCQLNMMDPEGNLLGMPDDWLGDLDPLRWKTSYVNRGMDEIRQYLSKKNTILNASGVVFRRFEGIESLVDVSMRLCADWLFWARLMSLGKIAYCAEPLNHWRLQTSNARTRPTGELEWEEGRRVIMEISLIISSSPVQEELMLAAYNQKCNQWLAKARS
jgi:glycosyltransferase involved in cell wall biosynthesis/ubiquinone/menaquinone biosynthesis C-methylase UbiE